MVRKVLFMAGYQVEDGWARQDEACPADSAAQASAFAEAALHAARSWRYTPAFICQAPDGFEGEDPCLAEGMWQQPARLRLSYAFRFSQDAGRGRVERID